MEVALSVNNAALVYNASQLSTVVSLVNAYHDFEYVCEKLFYVFDFVMS